MTTESVNLNGFRSKRYYLQDLITAGHVPAVRAGGQADAFSLRCGKRSLNSEPW